MKLLPIVLINAVLVAGAMVIYDQVRTEGPSTTYEAPGADSVVVAQLRERVRALEAGEPTLRASGPDPRLVARLDELEQRLAVRPLPPPRSGPPRDPPESAGEGFAVPEMGPGEALPQDEVSRFRRLMEAAEQQQREERERERIAAALTELDIKLDPQQTEKLMTAAREYRRKVGEVYRNAFAGARGPDGDREAARESARQGMEAVREEFAVTLNKFLPTGDTQKIVENVNRLGGGPRMMGGGPPRRGR